MLQSSFGLILLFSPYSDSKWGGIYFQKENDHTLSTRESGNSTSPTMKPLTVRGSQHKSLHTYTIITLGTLHKHQSHLPTYWQGYDDHHQQVLGCEFGKIRWCWTSLTTAISTFYQGVVLNNDLARLGPCWSLLTTFVALTSYFVVIDSYAFAFHTYLFLRAGVMLPIQRPPPIGMPIFRGSSHNSKNLLLIPPN